MPLAQSWQGSQGLQREGRWMSVGVHPQPPGKLTCTADSSTAEALPGPELLTFLWFVSFLDSLILHLSNPWFWSSSCRTGNPEFPTQVQGVSATPQARYSLTLSMHSSPKRYLLSLYYKKHFLGDRDAIVSRAFLSLGQWPAKGVRWLSDFMSEHKVTDCSWDGKGSHGFRQPHLG